ncbi:sporulation protein YunB [Bacillota bacterium Meth-B3]|nr:sporulation protein YunB [Eubacteriales bacterium]MEA5070110.1 sporulation protein YunB [Christensenellaceae bacterium]
MVARGARRGRTVLWVLMVFFILLASFIAWGTHNLTPVMIAMAEARARQLAVEAINNGIFEVMVKGRAVGYSDLIEVVQGENGQVSMLQANTLLMNELASRAALTTQRNLQALEQADISIPLGAALGMPLLGGAGPLVPVKVALVGSVTTKFVTAFETAGINQTRHEISLEASMLVRVVVPTGANSVMVTAYVPVAESILVGQVPQTYLRGDGVAALPLAP